MTSSNWARGFVDQFGGTITFDPVTGNLTFSPSTAVIMGDDTFMQFSTTAGITASTTQSQGSTPLTSEINEVATVANDGDVVTFPTAVAGRKVVIINNGSNTLQMFPASGDDLGVGVNSSRELEPNEIADFIAYDSTNWHVESSTEIIHAEMFDASNTDAFVMNAAVDEHAYHSNGLQAGDLADWAFDAGGAGTSIAIDSIADGGGGEIAVTCGAVHGLSVGDIISISNTGDANYDTLFIVNTITSTTIFEVTATFGGTATGTVDQAAVLTSDAAAAGQYLITWAASAVPAGNNETFDFSIHVNEVHQTSTGTRSKFGTAGDFRSVSGVSIINIAAGDKVLFTISNEDSAANLTLRQFTLVLVRL